jgi:hypothetical protein
VYAVPDLEAGPAEMRPRQAILCTDCGNTVDFQYKVGFCRICGGPLCSICAENVMEYSDSRVVAEKNYIIYQKTTTSKITTEVVLCKKCKKKHSDGVSRPLKWVTAGLLSLLGVVLAALTAIHMLNFQMFCWSVGLTVLILFFSIFAISSEKDRQISPLCPVCGADAMPFFFAQYHGADSTSSGRPDIIKCVCGYFGPRAPLDGLSKFVDAHGPALLDGTWLQGAAHQSWYARRRYRKF